MFAHTVKVGPTPLLNLAVGGPASGVPCRQRRQPDKHEQTNEEDRGWARPRGRGIARPLRLQRHGRFNIGKQRGRQHRHAALEGQYSRGIDRPGAAPRGTPRSMRARRPDSTKVTSAEINEDGGEELMVEQRRLLLTHAHPDDESCATGARSPNMSQRERV